MNRANAVLHFQTGTRIDVTERLEQLLAELRAINFFDFDYLSLKANDEIDRTAWAARRERLRQIRQEIEVLLFCLEPPTNRRQN
jgi:hypothetical protein